MNKSRILLTLLAFCTIIALWLLVPWLFKAHVPCSPFTGIWGQINNLEGLFSPINALFSGLAFGGLIVTIWVQLDTSKKQSFENNFFQLISLHKQNVIESSISSKQLTTVHNNGTGRSAFREMYYLLGAISESQTDKKSGRFRDIHRSKVPLIIQEIKNFSKSSNEKYAKYPFYAALTIFTKEVTSHTHRNVYHILKYIDESGFNEDVKKTYVRILRAQFNNYEFAILFYGTLFHREDKFKKLIEKYEFLHNFDKGLLLNLEDQKLYAESAYGKKGYESTDQIDQWSVALDLSQ